MIYRVYVLGRAGLTWASRSYWERVEKKFSGSLISSLISLSDVTFKGKVKKINTRGKFLSLKLHDAEPQFIVAVLADQEHDNQLTEKFLNNIYSLTHSLIQKFPAQVGTGLVHWEFTNELEKKIDSAYTHLTYPTPEEAQNLAKELYYNIVGDESEEILSNLKDLKQHAHDERDTAYQDFLESAKTIDMSNVSEETVLKNLHEVNMQQMLAHARTLKEKQDTTINSLIWIITGVYLHRLPLPYPAPAAEKILQEVRQLNGEIPPSLSKFLTLAKLEIQAKNSVKKAAEYRTFLEAEKSSLLETALQQDHPLTELLCVLLVGWYPEALDEDLLTKITDVLGTASPVLTLYLQTLTETCKIYSQSKSQAGLASIQELIKSIPQIETKGLDEASKLTNRAKLFHLATISSVNLMDFDWLNYDVDQLRSLLSTFFTNLRTFQSELKYPLPLSFAPMVLPFLVGQQLVARAANVYPKRKKTIHKPLRGMHTKLTNLLIKQLFAGRLDALHAYMYLSTFLMLFLQANLLTENKNLPDHLFVTLRLLFDDEGVPSLGKEQPLVKYFLLSLTGACAFLAPQIPIHTIREQFLQEINPYLLRMNRMCPFDRFPNDLYLQCAFKLQTYSKEEHPVTVFRTQNCEVLYNSLVERKDISPFVKGLLLGELSGGYFQISRVDEHFRTNAQSIANEAIKFWREASIPEDLFAFLKGKVQEEDD